MTNRIERELVVPATPEEVWAVLTCDGWLADQVRLDLRPGGDASFTTPDGPKTGWVEEANAPFRLAFWWAAGDEPATRVELTLRGRRDGTRLRVVETRPLELLDLVGIPLPGLGGATLGPALAAGERTIAPALAAA
jgi:uncharacterized protein YndB with AHSA1/START domain